MRKDLIWLLAVLMVCALGGGLWLRTPPLTGLEWTEVSAGQDSGFERFSFRLETDPEGAHYRASLKPPQMEPIALEGSLSAAQTASLIEDLRRCGAWELGDGRQEGGNDCQLTLFRGERGHRAVFTGMPTAQHLKLYRTLLEGPVGKVRQELLREAWERGGPQGLPQPHWPATP